MPFPFFLPILFKFFHFHILILSPDRIPKKSFILSKIWWSFNENNNGLYMLCISFPFFTVLRFLVLDHTLSPWNFILSNLGPRSNSHLGIGLFYFQLYIWNHEEHYRVWNYWKHHSLSSLLFIAFDWSVFLSENLHRPLTDRSCTN